MDGPPTRRMYSPDVGGAACEPSANIDKDQTSKRRFIVISEMTIYAGRQITQVVGRDRRARRCPAIIRGRPGGPSLPIWRDFTARQIFPCLAFSNQCKLVAPDQRLCSQRARVIIGGNHKAVRASAHDGEQITFMQFWHFPLQRKKIA